jgi:dihydrofolate reductase
MSAKTAKGGGTEERAEGSRSAPDGRRVVASTFVTLDGYMVGEDEDMSWVIQGFDREMQDDVRDALSERTGAFLLGRVTYEIFASYWPQAKPYAKGEALHPSEGREDPAIIHALNTLPKVAVSRTMKRAAWNNTRIVHDGLEDEVRKLKRQPGEDINIQGSASVVQALTRAGLIDEYQLYVHPVLLGAGKPLFARGTTRRDLELVGTKTYANGVLRLTYRRKM